MDNLPVSNPPDDGTESLAVVYARWSIGLQVQCPNCSAGFDLILRRGAAHVDLSLLSITGWIQNQVLNERRAHDRRNYAGYFLGSGSIVDRCPMCAARYRVEFGGVRGVNAED